MTENDKKKRNIIKQKKKTETSTVVQKEIFDFLVVGDLYTLKKFSTFKNLGEYFFAGKNNWEDIIQKT